MNNEALLQVIAKLLISGEIPAATLANWLVAVDLKNPLLPKEQEVLRAWIEDPASGLVESDTITGIPIITYSNSLLGKECLYEK